VSAYVSWYDRKLSKCKHICQVRAPHGKCGQPEDAYS
jgi:hypothetical protein